MARAAIRPPLPFAGVARTVGVVLAFGGGVALLVQIWDPFAAVFYLSYAVVGAILVARRPANPVGWLVFGVAFTFLGTSNPVDVDVAALRAGTASLRDAAWAWSGAWAGNASFFLYLALTLVFPSGALPRGRWRAPALAALALGALLVVVPMFGPGASIDTATGMVDVPNPLALAPREPAWLVLAALAGGVVPLILLVLGGVVGMLARYRGARGVERLQLRWLLASLAFVALAVVFGLTSLGILGEDFRYAWIPAIVAYPTVPIAIGFAVLRHRLYDIDLIVRRTLAYAVLSALLAAVYAGAVASLQLVVRDLLGGSSDLAVVASTLLVAALVLPLRRRVQRFIDRRFYRSRFDAEEALRSVAASVRSEVVPERLANAVLGVVARSFHPEQLSLWLRPAREGRGWLEGGERGS